MSGKSETLSASSVDTEMFPSPSMEAIPISPLLDELPDSGDSVTVTDVLQNRGTRAEDYCLLYHVNAGYPMLDEGAELVDDAEEVIPRTAWAEKHIKDRRKMTAPVPNQEEMCYFLRLKTPKVTLCNPKLGRKFTLAWSGDTLPHFVEWKSMASCDYALGLEPCTTELDDRFHYSKLPAGEKREFFVRMTASQL